MVVVGQKLKRVMRITPSGLEVESRTLFLVNSSIHPTSLDQRERLPCTVTARRSVQLAYVN
jgi:hypothetical protein